MKLNCKTIFRKAVTVVTLFCMVTEPALAALLNLANEPLIVGAKPAPQVMLTISKDQQLYKKAYNDYTDLDNDGQLDLEYKHSIEYYGYFDPTKCYFYQNGRFEPQNFGTDRKKDAKTGADLGRAPAYCNGIQWSGNFLNWVTMTRMDAVRKIFYGGMRVVDEAYDLKTKKPTETVLERAFVPADAHAWAKWYNGKDLKQLTPYDQTSTTVRLETITCWEQPKAKDPCAAFSSFPMPATAGDHTIRFSGTVSNYIYPGDQLVIADRFVRTRRVWATVVAVPTASSLTLRINPTGVTDPGIALTSVIINNLSSSGVTFCNVTPGSANAADPNSKSQTNTNAPLMRVARGNFSLWNANERVQCLWGEERYNLQSGFGGGLRSNGNQAALSGIGTETRSDTAQYTEVQNASAESPLRAVHAPAGPELGEFTVRVQVCVDDGGKLQVLDMSPQENKERCKRYPAGNIKPVGVLQEHGDLGNLHFGLMTGTHARNVSGGVLRKNPAPMSDEINVATDGTFKEADGKTFRLPYRPKDGSARTATSASSPPGIINTLNYMRVYGYRYAGASRDGYLGAEGDNCTYQLTSINENQCTSWGNPMSEVFFEAIRYFAAKDPNYTYASSGSKDNELGLPLASINKKLITANNYCASLNVVVVNAAVADNDDDLRLQSGTDINAAGNIASLTDKIGDLEKITDGKYFAGKVIGSTGAKDSDFELCTPKTITGLGNVSGICPEGPTLGGSYLMAGLAYQAKTNKIRTDLKYDETTLIGKQSLKVTSYGIQLATNTPRIEIVGKDDQKVVIQPIYRLDLTGLKPPGGVGGGGLVDMRYVLLDTDKAGNKRGKIYVNWEDSEQGGDYDQDMWGTIEWFLDVTKNTITVKTNAISASSANPQGFGYSISGTTQDGPQFHSGIYHFNYPGVAGVKGCVDCNLVGSGGQTGETQHTYSLETAGANELKDPLWYLAKYGGFDDKNENKLPDAATATTASEWDRKVKGTPDNYFLVTNPIGLVAALGEALGSVGGNTAGTSAATNSTSLQTITRVYQARFDAGPHWAGQLLSTRIITKDNKAEFVTQPDWDAGQLLNLANFNTGREIITFDDADKVRDGVPFRTGNVKSLDDALNIDPSTAILDKLGPNRLNYLRGDSSQQEPSGPFRPRLKSVLGDIVNSDPAFVGYPNATRTDPSFRLHFEKYFNRTPMLYVGANDGMLHGFDAETGQERIAYVPSSTFSKLNQLTNPDYQHRFFVDGAPAVDEVQLKADIAANTWRTVLVSALGLGGQGLFALDVTDPKTFSEKNASTLALWEFTDKDDPDLGYVTGRPAIRKVRSGTGYRWAAIVSGGYNNDEPDTAQGSGRAMLFVIFLDGPTGKQGGKVRTWEHGTDYIKIDTKLNTAGKPNGLAPPFTADVDADGLTDFVYAGDLQGNFWKFDLTNTDPKTWSDDTNRVILFTAKDAKDNPQPITAQAEGTLHPDRNLGGFIISFGTGKFLEKTDPLPPYTVGNTYYGIWDKNNGKSNVQAQTTVSNRTQLQQQVLTTDSTSGVRALTAEKIDWTTKLGWFIDFSDSTTDGERVVFRPLLLASRLIFTTLIPASHPCEAGGSSFIMIVDPGTGGRIDSVVLDVKKDNVLNAEDKITVGGVLVGASGLKSEVGVTPTPVVVRGGVAGTGGETSSKIYGTSGPLVAGVQGALGFTVMNSGGTPVPWGGWIGLKANSGRVSWREIVN
ncbi:MAG TPA: PilC/PilY family type IV pilus protein [Thermoanaerobaculia bacterium]|nr:PilC/PilY family type IV pilus protein [Burkholderiales bacterium]HYC61705.1 PilC/PilY family type IV pilus protein [Thermoanaerobaculia bacterium]